MIAPKDTDTYILSFPEDIQQRLEIIRQTIREAAPDAIEKISYAMPAFYLNGNLVYYAAYQNHIGFYPTSSGIEMFKDEFRDYTFSKGTIQFPHDKPLPLELITKIVRFRVNEALGKAKKKSK